MTSKIAFAESATVEVQKQVAEALIALGSFKSDPVNGWNVFYDVSRQRLALYDAHKSIAAALKIMSDTSWPTDADYDDAQ